MLPTLENLLSIMQVKFCVKHFNKLLSDTEIIVVIVPFNCHAKLINLPFAFSITAQWGISTWRRDHLALSNVLSSLALSKQGPLSSHGSSSWGSWGCCKTELEPAEDLTLVLQFIRCVS